MLVADRFKQIFGVYATEIWALSEDRFFNWLNSEAPEIQIQIKEKTNNEILDRIYGIEMAEPKSIRCMDCINYDTHDHRCKVSNHGVVVMDYCSRAERQEV